MHSQYMRVIGLLGLGQHHSPHKLLVGRGGQVCGAPQQPRLGVFRVHSAQGGTRHQLQVLRCCLKVQTLKAGQSPAVMGQTIGLHWLL